MNETTITTGSDLLWTLAHVTNRDEAGRHFTEVYPDDQIEALEGLGLIAIDRPVHEPTGLPYSPEYYHLSVTEEGQETVDNLYDGRDYNEDGTPAD
jgi:hypothetical protein